MTIAEILGFRVGEYYVLKKGSAFLKIKPGDRLKFHSDDGSCRPWFGPNAEGDYISVGLDFFELPDVIRINKRRVPKPQREPPEAGTAYYIPLLTGERYIRIRWGGDPFDLDCLKNGLVHLTQEAAKKHSKALRSFTKTKKGE